MKKMKLLLVSSRGGHLYQLFLLKEWWRHYDRVWLTGEGKDVQSLLKNEIIYYGYFPESRNVLNALRNFFTGIKIIRKEKPSIIVSCGAGIAPPVFLAGKLFSCILIFIDSYTFVKYPSLSARIISYFSNLTITQHKSIQTKLKKSKYLGSIL